MAASSRKDRFKLFTGLGLLAVGIAVGVKIFYKKRKPSLDIELPLHRDNVLVPKNIDICLKVALSAAYEAGNEIKKFINDKDIKSNSLLTKSNSADFVTEIDKKCEKIILNHLSKQFPMHHIIAEESCLHPNNHKIKNGIVLCI